MTVDELVDNLTLGREIEFSFQEHPYFLAPKYLKNGCFMGYYIYDVLLDREMIIASIDEVLTFEFAPQISFKENISCFTFDCIL